MAAVQLKGQNAFPAVPAANGNVLQPQATVTISCRAHPGYTLAVAGDGKHVVLAPAPMHDLKQHWIKDEHWGVTVKDQEGRPAFAIVNIKTGQAIQHPDRIPEPITPAVQQSHPEVRLVPYNPAVLDKSVLWTEEEAGEGFCYIRELKDAIKPIVGVSFERKVLDAINTDKIVLSSKKGSFTQHWNIKRD